MAFPPISSVLVTKEEADKLIAELQRRIAENKQRLNEADDDVKRLVELVRQRKRSDDADSEGKANPSRTAPTRDA